MLTVHLHPTAALAPPPLRQQERPLTYGIHDVARRMGWTTSGEPVLVRRITLLIRIEGFPHPLPRVVGTGVRTGLDAMGSPARWDRRAVEAWFDGLLPPGARETVLASQDRDAAAALDANADRLDDLLGQRGRR